MAELEEFLRTYPEASAKKLAELDKVRIEERANLKHKHKNTKKEVKVSLHDDILKHHTEPSCLLSMEKHLMTPLKILLSSHLMQFG